MVQVYRVEKKYFLYHECFVLIAMKSVRGNNEEHKVHDILRLLPSLSLAHATSTL